MIDRERALGAVLGGAIGDALGMPLEGLSHQNVRTYYRGVRGFAADEKRGDLSPGQWTFRTQMALSLGSQLAAGERASLGRSRSDGPWRRLAGDAPPPAGAAPAVVAPLAVWAVARGMEPEGVLSLLHDALAGRFPGAESQVAAFAQVEALAPVLRGQDLPPADGWLSELIETTEWAENRLAAGSACSDRLASVRDQIDSFPLDLQEACGGTGYAADEAWPFAMAMFARRPRLVEATLLSAVNVGGDAPTVGACAGALLGALNGQVQFPPAWRDQLEKTRELEDMVERLVDR